MTDTGQTAAGELRQARERLDECEVVVEKLHRLCCEPGRSPRMKQILADIERVREQIDSFAGADSADEITATLEGIGAQVGHLQVACCTDARTPLYADTLSGLSSTQIHIARSVGKGH